MQFGIERSGNCSGNNVNRNEKSGLLAIKKAALGVYSKNNVYSHVSE